MRKTFQIVLLGMACFMSVGCDRELAVLNLGSKFMHEVGDDVGSMTIKEGHSQKKWGLVFDCTTRRNEFCDDSLLIGSGCYSRGRDRLEKILWDSSGGKV